MLFPETDVPPLTRSCIDTNAFLPMMAHQNTKSWRCWCFALTLICSSALWGAEATGPIISEFAALNQSTLRDENGDSSDWIEILNDSTNAVNLLGWHLTDNATQPAKWTFPDTPLAAGQYLVVFASGKDRAVAGQELHTNFKLSGDGEYLALTRPDFTVASEYAPQFPPQGLDISYGRGLAVEATMELVTEGMALRYYVPTNNSVDGVWTQPGFDDSPWSNAPAPMGFDRGGAFRSYADVVLADEPLYYWNFDEPSGVALNQASPDIVQDALTPQGGASRAAHSTLPLGSAAVLDGITGTRFYADSVSIGSDIIGPWAVEFWLQAPRSQQANLFHRCLHHGQSQ